MIQGLKKLTGFEIANDAYEVIEFYVAREVDAELDTLRARVKKLELLFVSGLLGGVAEKDRELLEAYTKFLLEFNYVDDDVWCEKPTAVDRFLSRKEDECHGSRPRHSC